MKFSHIADCHLGGWRDTRLKELNREAFFRAVELCIEEKVDFILIAGDLFNTAVPSIEVLRDIVKAFKELRDKGISVYLIPGSHDFSPSGKTMLDVLEEAGLCINVVKGNVHDKKLRLRFTIDGKTGAKITGMLGRRGMLERAYYEELDRKHLEKEEGFKIFMFHSPITELKPGHLINMESAPISLLPAGFDYYAGGHVHIVEKAHLPGYINIVYPGPLFPNNFSELEELKHGGFYIYNEGEIIRKNIILRNVEQIFVDATRKSPLEIEQELIEASKGFEARGSIVLIRIKGVLESGKLSDINFRRINELLLERDAYIVMRNTSGVSAKEFDEIKLESASSEAIEERLIEEHCGKMPVSGWDRQKEIHMIKQLMAALSSEKKEGEKAYEFEARIKGEIDKLLGISS